MENVIKRLSLLFALFAVVFSCSKEPAVITVSSVSLNKTQISLRASETATLIATVNPSDATDKAVIWSSSDESVATVTDGVVTAVKAGSATITARAGDKTAACAVTVAATEVSSITLDKSEASLKAGETLTLTATVYPSDATDKAVIWSSSDESVATVTDGVVTAVKAGSATITARAGDKTATCVVTVAFCYPIPDAVDLGLSVKWASFNVGASSPEQLGDYFAWGETTTKEEFTSSNYSIPKTWTNDLDAEHDVASVALGDGWRMPTKQEIWEMQDNCDFEVTKINDTDVIKITGPNGNFIYFPLRERYWTSSVWLFAGQHQGGHYLYFTVYRTYRDEVSEGYDIYESEFYGYEGACVRPVRD